MKIAIIGAGNVGQALGKKLSEAGHTVTFAVRNAANPKSIDIAKAINANVLPIPEAVQTSEVILLATPWTAAESAIQSAGDLAGKILIDATNPLSQDFSRLEIGHTDSAGEQVQRWAPEAKVVKAFNTVGFNIMAAPEFDGTRTLMYVAGNDADANATVKGLAEDVGFDVIVANSLSAARLTEPFAMLWIASAYSFGLGRDFAFGLLRR